MLSPRGQTVLEADILSSASASWFCPQPRPRPRGFVLVLGLVLRSLASINITDSSTHQRLQCFNSIPFNNVLR